MSVTLYKGMTESCKELNYNEMKREHFVVNNKY